MKIKDAIAKFRQRTGSEIENPDLLGWLSDLDIMINREVLLTHEGCGSEDFDGYDQDADQDTVLLVPRPYTDIYWHWLALKNAELHQEVEEYNAHLQLFAELKSGYADYINRNHMPLGCRLRLV